jgi:hypothetical protein
MPGGDRGVAKEKVSDGVPNQHGSGSVDVRPPGIAGKSAIE